MAEHDGKTEAMERIPTDEPEGADEVDDFVFVPRDESKRGDPDMLLALQMSLEASDNHDSFFPYTNEQPDGSAADNIKRPDSPTSEEEDLDLAHAISESLRPDTAAPWRAPRPRDRYDVAGIATYRVDPRRENSFYRRAETKRPGSAWYLYGVPPPDDPAETGGPDDLQTSQPRAPGIESYPILNQAAGSALVDTLNADTIHHIVDFLCFPDAFAFALTCKSIHIVLDLKFKKQQYWNALKLVHTSNINGRSKFCGVCLYLLPSSYFPKHQITENETESIQNNAICTDYQDSRARVVREAELNQTTNVEKVASCSGMVAPVWRPSRRIVIGDTDGFCWYRERI